MGKQAGQPEREQDPRQIAEAIERGEIPEGVPAEDSPRQDKRLDRRRSKLGQLNAN